MPDVTTTDDHLRDGHQRTDQQLNDSPREDPLNAIGSRLVRPRRL